MPQASRLEPTIFLSDFKEKCLNSTPLHYYEFFSCWFFVSSKTMVTSGRVTKQMCGFPIYIVELSVNPRRDTLPVEFTTMLRLLETEKTTKSYRAHKNYQWQVFIRYIRVTKSYSGGPNVDPKRVHDAGRGWLVFPHQSFVHPLLPVTQRV